MYLIIIIALLFILFLSSNYNCSCKHCKKKESFKIKRYRRKGKKIKIGTLNNTPKPIKGLMKNLNKIGLQIDADSEHDVVADEYLDKDNIK